MANLGPSGTTGYLLYHPATNKYVKSRYIVFVENKNYNDWQREFKIECQNLLLEHNYAMTVVANNDEPCKLDNYLPSSFNAAISCKFAHEWKNAILHELEAIEKQKVWHVVDYEPNLNVIDTKWVFTCKYNKDNIIPKARLVARGFKDSNDYSSFDTYTPGLLPALMNPNRQNF